MRTIAEIRRLRLEQLKRETGLSYADMNERLGRSRRDATLSQIAKAQPNSGTGKPRQMGDAQARNIEAIFNKAPGWLDQDPAFDAKTAAGWDCAPGHSAAEPLPEYQAQASQPIEVVLERFGLLLRHVPPLRREALARLLDGWAREGGAPHYIASIAPLLAGPPASKPSR